jgi:hypothetical protein
MTTDGMGDSRFHIHCGASAHSAADRLTHTLHTKPTNASLTPSAQESLTMHRSMPEPLRLRGDCYRQHTGAPAYPCPANRCPIRARGPAGLPPGVCRAPGLPKAQPSQLRGLITPVEHANTPFRTACVRLLTGSLKHDRTCQPSALKTVRLVDCSLLPGQGFDVSGALREQEDIWRQPAKRGIMSPTT